VSNAVLLADSQNYPLLNLFWTMLIFFCWVLWFVLLFRIFGDLFRSDDLSGWGKAGWSILIILIPFLGVLIYVIARGDSMRKRDLERAQASQEAFGAYVKQTAGTSGTAEELTKLADLRTQGILTEAEFTAQKSKLLA
jgi:Short C-terminal domain/Phospholipase_D-nuclease N-terminal